MSCVIYRMPFFLLLHHVSDCVQLRVLADIAYHGAPALPKAKRQGFFQLAQETGNRG